MNNRQQLLDALLEYGIYPGADAGISEMHEMLKWESLRARLEERNQDARKWALFFESDNDLSEGW